ncbi:hypothetical protein ES692_01800 [Psychroserpens burtonensis]|uniref:Lipocalin-like domain-containing protein n=1 Tax=Psychroserpens burtonensis TaxID=49278 RepID=A0A5C7BKH4_9FLAO|nr:hypothetical protein [Psychroserpens burtonensis]TXE20018.1 hypothetical protein ES692_01800 [Psychroserpens burtonensis]
MKKLFLSLFVLTGLVLTTACSSDDDGGNGNTNADVAGTWKLTSLLTQSSLDINNDGNSSNDLLVESDCYLDDSLVFGASGIGSIISNSFLEVEAELVVGTTDEFTYSINCFIEEDIYAMTYTVSGNTVTIVDEDMFTVVGTVSGNTFNFVIPEGYEIVDEDFEVVLEEDLTFTYTKQ